MLHAALNPNFQIIARFHKYFNKHWGKRRNICIKLAKGNVNFLSWCMLNCCKLLFLFLFINVLGSVVEKGDSGGGVTIISNDLHYIIGIVSLKHKSISFFTNVSWTTHVSWLKTEIRNIDKDIINLS